MVEDDSEETSCHAETPYSASGEEFSEIAGVERDPARCRIGEWGIAWLLALIRKSDRGRKLAHLAVFRAAVPPIACARDWRAGAQQRVDFAWSRAEAFGDCGKTQTLWNLSPSIHRGGGEPKIL
jgi:hypothetical protein